MGDTYIVKAKSGSPIPEGDHLLAQTVTSWSSIPKKFSRGLPTSVPGLMLWLRADIGIWQDSDMTTKSLADGDPVGAWQDYSGNNYHAKQTTGSRKPTYKLNVKNGRPVIRYDGVDDCLATPAFTLGVKTVFMVRKNTQASSYNYIRRSSGIDDVFWNTTGGALKVIRGGVTSAWDRAGGLGSNGLWRLFLEIYDGTHTGHTIKVNNALETLTNVANGNPGTNTTSSIMYIGSDDGSYALAGDIAEFVVYNRVLTDFEQTKITNYLNGRWVVY